LGGTYADDRQTIKIRQYCHKTTSYDKSCACAMKKSADKPDWKPNDKSACDWLVGCVYKHQQDGDGLIVAPCTNML